MADSKYSPDYNGALKVHWIFGRSLPRCAQARVKGRPSNSENRQSRSAVTNEQTIFFRHALIRQPNLVKSYDWMGATYEYVLNARADDCERVGSTFGHEKYGFERFEGYWGVVRKKWNKALQKHGVQPHGDPCNPHPPCFMPTSWFREPILILVSSIISV